MGEITIHTVFCYKKKKKDCPLRMLENDSSVRSKICEKVTKTTRKLQKLQIDTKILKKI